MTWPPPPEQPELSTEFAKILYQAQVAETAAQRRDRAASDGHQISEKWEYRRYGWELDKAEAAAEHALQKSIHDARVAVAQSAIERSYKGAEFVRLSAGVIATVYTGIAGLTFAAQEARSLPPRGIVPGIFLGLALVLATAHAAWLTKAPSTPAPVPHSSFPEYQDRRLNTFVRWCSGIALQRAYVLHAAVLSLGAGAVFLPSPFVSMPEAPVWIVAGALLVTIFLVPLQTANVALRPSRGGRGSAPSG